MDDEEADRCWAMLALAAPNSRATSARSRVSAFIRRDKSPNKVRSALLVAGLAGLGRISTDDRQFAQPPLRASASDTTTSWTQMIDAAAGRGQAATVLVLTGTGFQTPNWDKVPAAHLLSRDHRAASAPARTSPRG